MTRTSFLRTLGLGLATRARRPNVLFIAIDDLRPELGIYGAGQVKSPHIDALGRSGMVFTRAYCQQALCNPSRASMLTGLRPDTLRVWNLQTDFRTTRPDAITLPQRFKEAGYHTVGIGKIFHNSFPDPASWSEPDLRIPGYPFDPDAVYRSEGEVAYLEQRKGAIAAAGDQAKYVDPYGEWYLKSSASEAPDVPDNAYFDGAQTDVAIAKLAALQAAGTPFFFGVGYYRPHLPFNVPKRYWDLYDREKIALAANRYLPKDSPPMAHNMNRELRGYRDFAEAPRPDHGTLPEDEAHAIELANDIQYGLSSYVWTENLGRAHRVRNRLSHHVGYNCQRGVLTRRSRRPGACGRAGVSCNELDCGSTEICAGFKNLRLSSAPQAGRSGSI